MAKRAGPGASPLVTTRRVGNRMEIAAASPEAHALGLNPSMPVASARALFPGLDIRDADPAADAAVLGRLALFAARRWTPRAGLSATGPSAAGLSAAGLSPSGLSGADGLWLDLDGVAHLFGGEEAMCRRILGLCARAGYAARIAVAGTAGAAHALARYGDAALTLCPPGG